MGEESPLQPVPRETRRVFLALPISEEVRATLWDISVRLQKAAHFLPIRAVWVPPENFHVTLHFLGATPSDLVKELAASLPSVCGRMTPFALSFRGLGYFPHDKAPRVLWAGVQDPPEELTTLYKGLKGWLEGRGVELEHDNFHPHVTLARFKALKGTAPLVTTARQHQQKVFGTSDCARLDLMESHPRAGGAEYTVIASAPLRAETGQA